MAAAAVPKLETAGAGDSKGPSGFLGEILGAPVTVKLNSGVVYKGEWARGGADCWRRMLTGRATGELQSVDGYMNIALEQTKEYVDGRLRREYGDAFIRGNNGAPPPSSAQTLRLLRPFVCSDPFVYFDGLVHELTAATVMYISADS